ncbi:MAG: phosphatidate cytidylyltransferase [Ahrensia sp.]|nr:phosphatidate cytidylyltransferase [Ahrensia sp.]
MTAPQRTRFRETELGLRIASAIVLLIVILSAAWVGGWVFALLCGALSGVLFYEWLAMVSRTPFDMPEAVLTLGFAFLLLMCLIGYPLTGLIVMLVVGFIIEWLTDGIEREDVRWIGLGALYCAIPAFALPIIRDNSGFGLLLLLFLIVWVTDIGAYFAGRHFGGPKLMPAISPKKTWSGAIGGLVCAVAVALIFGALSGSISPWPAALFAAFLSIASQIGDLFESWVKRRVNVKDSSGLIPGHGGFLDRVDGLSVAALPVGILVLLSLP